MTSRPRATDAVDVSVIVTVTERPEPLDALYREFSAPIRASGRTFEFVFVLEPWGHTLTDALEELIREGEPISVLEAGRTFGEAALLRMAGEHCRGRLILTLPAYRRVQAEGVPHLLDRAAEGVELVVARRWPRTDSWMNRLQNRLFHALLSGGMRGQRFHDVASGVRVMPREVLLALPLYGDFFRFLPLLAQHEGYTVEELDIPQHPEDRPARIVSPGIYVRRLIDLLGLFFLLRFTEKPLRFFGLVGALFSAAGAMILGILLVQRLGGQGIADRPMLLLGVLLFVLGVQAIALGLVGEIIVHVHAGTRRRYRLRPDTPTPRTTPAHSPPDSPPADPVEPVGASVRERGPGTEPPVDRRR